MVLLREDFSKLASWLNNTGLPDALDRTENKEELEDLWKFFEETNRLLIIEAKHWKDYFQSYKHPIFKAFEDVKYPSAVACLIRIMGMKEEELFWDKEDLKRALIRENKPFSKVVARLMNTKSIIEITSGDIFSK